MAPARKRFGQHFLTDFAAIARIVEAIDPQPADRILEIGPGRAALTQILLQRIASLQAIEIDRDLAQGLRARFTSSRLDLIEGDALQIDYQALAANRPIRLVGNLPYNISTPLLVHLIAFRQSILDQHFMLQKEVVLRIVAEAGHSAYGRLSVLLQAFYQVQYLFDVGAESFEPPPKVTSSVLRMRPRTDLRAPTLQSLERLTHQAFAQKRKMLRKTLLPWLDQQGIDSTAIDPTARAEEIPVSVYCTLARQMDLRLIDAR
jgi:16S rRNA (adenine1518-N6/adenine1519-N6)-dimethyltransferase